MNEHEALCALRRGDDSAISWFIERYGNYVATIVGNMLRPSLSDADVEEVSADVFVALWRNCASVPDSAVRPYIAGIARNKALCALRRRRRDLPLNDDVLELPDVPIEHALTEAELAERTRAAVLAMGEPDRSIFLRHYFYSQPIALIALELDMNTNTVKSRLRRGREKLRAELTEED